MPVMPIKSGMCRMSGKRGMPGLHKMCGWHYFL